MPGSPTPPTDADIAAILARTRALHRVPGMAAAVVGGGRVQAAAADGVADLATGRAADPTLWSRWYSISKALTTIALLDLARARRLDLDAPLVRLLPDLRFASDDATRHATLRDCLLHRTGLTGGNWTWDGAATDPAALLRLLPAFPCPHRTGVGSHYQNLHFLLIERAMAAAGVPWAEAMAALAGRLGARIITDQAAFIAGRRFAPHGPNGLGEPQPIDDVAMQGVPAAGGGCGTIHDLAIFAGLAAGAGVWQGVEVLPDGWWAQATAALQRGDDPRPGDERTGTRSSLIGTWTLYRGQSMLVWAGGHRGYTSHALAIPALGIAACALGNRSGSPATDAVCLELIDRCLGVPSVDWPERYRVDKAALRAAGAERLAARRAEAVSGRRLPEGCAGTFEHPAYGRLQIIDGGEGARLRFRWIDLPLAAAADGRWLADGAVQGGEVLWDLRPAHEPGIGWTWAFNPDDAAHPVVFRPARP